VRRVLLKQARGHAAFELNEPRLDAPESIWFGPLHLMDPDQRQRFEEDETEDWSPSIWPEVGSRSMQRLLVVGAEVFQEPWLVVQDGRYRYRVDQDDGLRVRMVLSELLACVVVWD
jgi:hypothetical protein